LIQAPAQTQLPAVDTRGVTGLVNGL